MRHWISLFIIIFSSVAFGDDKTTLYDFRYWSAPDHTRIVIDKEEHVSYEWTSRVKAAEKVFSHTNRQAIFELI